MSKSNVAGPWPVVPAGMFVPAEIGSALTELHDQINLSIRRSGTTLWEATDAACRQDFTAAEVRADAAEAALELHYAANRAGALLDQVRDYIQRGHCDKSEGRPLDSAGYPIGEPAGVNAHEAAMSTREFAAGVSSAVRTMKVRTPAERDSLRSAVREAQSALEALSQRVEAS